VKSRGFNVVEATCPLVRFAHQSTHQLARAGFHIIVIGRRDHVEVRGLTGDLDEFDVVMNEEEINKLAKRPRFGVTAQTTQPIDKVKRIVAALRHRFPESEVRFIDTVCQPTKLRQRAAIELAQCADVVVVIGGASSNNTKELVATCRSHCSRVYHVQDADEIDASWIVGADVIGITAGTSTPASSIEAVESRLHQLARSVSRCHGLVPA
jgi:4-hydroxy-3-methylbut-2-enyl diphosphate reductase